MIVTSPATPVLSNSIYGNQKLGIELQGGNNAQPAPVLTSAVSMNATSTIAGTLTSAAGAYTLQFFATPTLNASGNAEGQVLLGTASVTVVGASASFSLPIPSGFTPGDYVTATATDAAGNTSQFSAGIAGTGMGNGLGPPTLAVVGSSPTVPAGQAVTDTFTITNPFSVSDAGLIFTDPIPAGTTFVSGMTSTGAPVTSAGGVATATIGTLPAGQAVTVTIVLRATAAAVPSFTNVGTISATTPPLASGTVTASVTTAVTASADLGVTITGPTGPISVGKNLTYVVMVTNGGPSDATQVILADALPAGVTFVSAAASSGPAPVLSNGVLTDNYGALTNGASFSLTIVVTAGVATVPIATDTASVAAFESDPNPANNTATFSSDVTPVADVSVAVVGSAASVGVGQGLTYTVTVTNAGPSPATGVILNDVLPGSVTFVSAVSSSGQAPTESGGTVTDAIAMLAAGESVTVTIAVVPTASAPPSIKDSAGVTANEPDPNLANNAASATTMVFPVADLAIVSQAVAPDPVAEGNSVTILINVANNGPSTATGASLSEALPAGLTFLSGTADGGAVTTAGGMVVAPIGDLASGATSVITIIARADAAGALTVVATVSEAGVIDPVPANNTATTTFQSVAIADVAVALTAVAGPVYTGDVLTYTAVVTNNGPSPATNVTFTDPLTPGVSFLSIEANQVAGSVVAGVAVQPLGTIAAGASVTVILMVVPTQAGTVVDTATVSATEPDPVPGNNTATVSTALIVPQSLVTFSSPSYVANSTDGLAPVTLLRSGYEEDSVTVHFSTIGGGNATPGVDYVPVSEVVVIPAGSAQVTVLVPVLNNLFDNKNVVVRLQIDTPTGSAILEPGTPGGTSPVNASLTIIDVNPDLIGPTVTALKLSGYVNSITSIEVDTSGHLDPTTATNPANYTITALGGVGKAGLPYGTVVPVARVGYDATTGAVFLVPARPLPGNELFLVVVNGSGPMAVTDLAGNPLNSVFGARPGGDYTLTVARGTNITYHDNNDVPVTLKLTGPGTIDVDRFVDGQLQFLQVVGGVGGKTVITGTSHPLLRRSIIGSILGLGQFGSIRVKLTTPPFFVINTVYPNLQTQVGPPAIDTLYPTPPPPPPAPKPARHPAKPKAAAAAPTPAHPGTIKARAIAIPAGRHVAPPVHQATPSTVRPTVSASRHPHAPAAHARPGR